MHDSRRLRDATPAFERLTESGVTGWRDGSAAAEVLFLGRNSDGRREGGFASAPPDGERPQSRMRQVHGAKVLAARPGECGEGDAQVTAVAGLALAVVTADCVPVLIAAGDRVAAIHAGWRGFVAGVIAATLDELGDSRRAIAWIGPAIGPCCYEVGEEVAVPVAARSTAAVLTAGGRGRPHLDLPLAVEIELARRGVGEIRRLSLCTACHPELLESYRRDGAAAGRNRSLIWLREGRKTQEG